MTELLLDDMTIAALKDALLRKRGEILAVQTGTRPLPASLDVNSRQGDLADQASGNNEVHIALKLKQTDAKILQAIEEALWRIDKGTYGVCRDCGEPIADPEVASRAATGKAAEAARQIFAEDSAGAAAFVDRWRPRVTALPNA